MIDLNNKPCLDSKCLVSMNDDSWIWHKRFAHANMDLIDKLSKNDLVFGLPWTTTPFQNCNPVNTGKLS